MKTSCACGKEYEAPDSADPGVCPVCAVYNLKEAMRRVGIATKVSDDQTRLLVVAAHPNEEENNAP